MPRNYKVVLAGCGLIMAAAVTYGVIDNQNRKEAEKAKTEHAKARTKAFAQYIIDDAYADATKEAYSKNLSLDRQDANRRTKENPKRQTSLVQALQTDSARYANLIVRNASIIHDIDASAEKEVDFAAAWDIVRNTPKDSCYSEYAGEYVAQIDDGLKCAGLPTKAEEDARKRNIMMINHGDFKDICTQLIINREAMNKAR